MGGHIKVFRHETEPISAKIALSVQNDICERILNKYPDVELLKIGSVGHKRDDDTHSDIDIAIKCDTIEHLYDMISSVFGDELATLETLYIVSYCHEYVDIFDDYKTKYVQCDFMLSHDIEYTRFRYDCPDYKNDESNYKVGHKIMFMNMILNHCDEKNEGCDDTCYGKYDFSPIGLYRNIITKTGYQLVDREFVTTDVETIMHIPFNDEITYDDFISVETLWNALHTDKFKYPDELKIIELNLFKNSYRKGWTHINPHDFKCVHWTEEEINEFLKTYEIEHVLNNMLINNSEK